MIFMPAAQDANSCSNPVPSSANVAGARINIVEVLKCQSHAEGTAAQGHAIDVIGRAYLYRMMYRPLLLFSKRLRVKFNCQGKDVMNRRPFGN